MRDLVTPGADRSADRIADNAFPVFEWKDRLVFRYMRYWIECGHERAGRPLASADHAAFDALEAELGDPDNVLSFRMKPGDLLFIDNTLVAHDRDAYRDDQTAPRLMLRLWLHAT